MILRYKNVPELKCKAHIAHVYQNVVFCLFELHNRYAWFHVRMCSSIKVHIFWEGHKILRNLHFTFDWHYIGQK